MERQATTDGGRDGPVDGGSDSQGAEEDGQRDTGAVQRVDGKAGRWLEEGGRDGGMQGQMEAQLDVTDRWRAGTNGQMDKEIPGPKRAETTGQTDRGWTRRTTDYVAHGDGELPDSADLKGPPHLSGVTMWPQREAPT